MARARIADDVGRTAVELAVAGDAPRNDVATAVRYLLQALAERAPGNTLEVRVPPFGAVQAVEGPRHTRGTPPNVIEMDASTWIAIATGRERWDDAVSAGRVSASGTRANLRGLVPLVTGTMDA